MDVSFGVWAAQACWISPKVYALLIMDPRLSLRPGTSEKLAEALLQNKLSKPPLSYLRGKMKGLPTFPFCPKTVLWRWDMHRANTELVRKETTVREPLKSDCKLQYELAVLGQHPGRTLMGKVYQTLDRFHLFMTVSTYWVTDFEKSTPLTGSS